MLYCNVNIVLICCNFNNFQVLRKHLVDQAVLLPTEVEVIMLACMIFLSLLPSISPSQEYLTKQKMHNPNLCMHVCFMCACIHEWCDSRARSVISIVLLLS